MSKCLRGRLLPIGVAWALGACAGRAPQGVTPADLPSLEAEVSRSPGDAAALTRLGIAYYNAKNFTRARDALQSSLSIAKVNYPGRVYLGLTFEELGQLDSARVAYAAASADARRASQRREIENRLELLTRRELQAAAKAAVARESELAAQPPEPNLVAVLPFSFVGLSDSLRPLARGLTHLVITDLGKLSTLRLLERERVQALTDELQLSESARIDPASGARSGRILRAARVVQGSLQDLPTNDELKFDATVVSGTDASVVARGSGSDQLRQIFAVEKAVVFQLVDRLGISLTPAERRALTERPTADLQAFLLFSRGLEAQDRGDFTLANENFSAAAARDPNFRAAREQQAASARAEAAVTTSDQQLAGLGPTGDELPALPEDGTSVVATTTVSEPTPTSILRTSIAVTVPTVGGGLTSRVGVGAAPGPTSSPPEERPPLQEALGSDTPVPQLIGTIVIIITRP